MRISGQTGRLCGVAALAAGWLVGCESAQPDRRPAAPRASTPERAESRAPADFAAPAPAAPERRDAPQETPPAGQPRQIATPPDPPARSGSHAHDGTAPAPTVPPEAPAPETPAEEPVPTWPGYLHVVERFDRVRPPRITAVQADDYRLSVDTDNVRQLRIDRRAAGLTQRRSVVLRLDDQPFEWRADSSVTVFERSELGVWRPVPPEETGARRDRSDGG